MAPVNHLHSESKIMPVKDHNQMLTKQFLYAAQNPNHPNFRQRSQPQRIMKNTMETQFMGDIEDIIPPTGVNDINKKGGIQLIHSRSVTNTILELGVNKVLNEQPPQIDKSEKRLPRKTRGILSQLRSGYSPQLNSYLARINPEHQNICQKCNLPGHTTNHLFNCPTNPTNLDVRSLWTNPKEAAMFLELDVGSTDLEPD